ncbi:MAG: hypothetical protein VX237_03120, partial [Chloroflexota bacterium]|nr:hypothetical protein [Chloroflexota bacterium]
LTNLPSTPIRNFIIDGDFTQWPEGDRTNAGNGQYGSALFSVLKYGTSAVFDIKQSTDIPTLAQSNHLSKTSMHVDCTTADTSVAAADYFILAYHITGYDYAHLHGQEVTFATWVKSDITGVYSVAFRGTVGGRTYGTSFTISSADTWEYKTITLTLDTSDASYNFDEGKGLDIYISLIAGSNYNFSSPGSWQAEGKLTAPNQVNFGSADTNDFRMAQTGLYLGASAPTFTSPAISTVKNQVDYYIQRLDFDDGGDMMIQAGVTDAVGSGRIVINLASSMRISPTITSSAANTFLWFEGDFTNQAPSGVSFSGISQTFFRLTASLSSAAVGAGFLRRDGTDTSWIMA